MSITIRVDRELDKEFIGDVLVTAFDGSCGACWYWARPAGRFWLTSEQNPENLDPAYSFWTAAHIRTQGLIGIKHLDAKQEGGWFTVDGECIRIGIQKILDLDPHANIDPSVRNYIVRGVLESDAGDIDAIAADCIVQIGLFGRIVFG